MTKNQQSKPQNEHGQQNQEPKKGQSPNDPQNREQNPKHQEHHDEKQHQGEMRKIVFSRLITGLCLSVCASVGLAQTCPQTVGGNYTYSALGTGAPGSLLTGTGTGTGTSTGTGTTTNPAFTTTEVGLLLNGLGNPAAFSTPGSFFFDGSGNIRGTFTPQGGLTTNVGTYVVNSDCTITVTLTDAFGTNKTVANLQGFVLNNGSEIDVGVIQNTSTTGSTGGSTGSTTSSPPGFLNGLNESTVLIKLVRPFSASCNLSNLTGPYAIIATGRRAATVTTTTATGSTSSTQMEAPLFWFGRVQFDGNGKITAPSGTQTPLSSLQFTGSYTVNNNCTGTMTLTGPTNTTPTGSGSGGTGTGSSATPLSVNFVLTQPAIAFSGGAPVPGGSTKPGIEFSLSSGSQTLIGYGRPQ
jgi:hypothetical protein